MPYNTDGIDVNITIQGQPNWQQVRSAGYQVGLMKLTEGISWPDTQTLHGEAQCWDNMKASMPYRGVYHFARPNNDPVAEAHHFLWALASIGGLGADDLPPILDFEETGGLQPKALQAWCQKWLDTVQGSCGRQPIIYTYPSFWKSPMGNTASFSQYPLWIAEGGVSTPWTGPFQKVVMWQYGQTKVPGIPSQACDINHCDTAALDSLRQTAGPPAKETGNVRFNTPFIIDSPVVAAAACSSGGAWVLTERGSVYAFGCPDYGAPDRNQHGEGWSFPARMGWDIYPSGPGYTVEDTAHEKYEYGPAA